MFLGRERLQRGFTILHVCTDADDVKDAQKRVDQVVSGQRVVIDVSGLAAARFEVQSLPTVWLIAPDGTAIGRASGAKDWTAEAQTKLIARWLPGR